MAEPIRLIIGASSQNYRGWVRTQQSELDLTVEDEWTARFAPGSITCILAEHVWEHLTTGEAALAARICHRFLAPGGWVRCAVPDGHFPDAGYQRTVQVGGPGPENHPAASHKVVYTSGTLSAVFANAGFDVHVLEWWDETGTFHHRPWDERQGFVYRSRRFDHRNKNGTPGFTSLIVDAIKPGPIPEGKRP